MQKEIDNILNRYTMYRVLLYGLIALLAIAVLFGFTGAISISAGSLLLSIALLVISCYVTNKLYATLLHVPTNYESWLISALILACIMPPASSASYALYTLLAGAIAISSKFLIRLHGRHIFNPVAFGAFILGITGLLPATWWIATPWLTPFTVLLALIVLRKQRSFLVFSTFALTSITLLLFTGSVLQGVGVLSMLHMAIMSWPIIFFGSVMLTEPATAPPTHYYQLLLAGIVGVLFTSQLHIGQLATTPELVLLIGNTLTTLAFPLYGYVLKVNGLRKLTTNMYELDLDRPHTLHFKPGQYAEITFPHSHSDDRGNRRTFSIASSTADTSTISFAFKATEKGSSFKKALLQAKSGSVVRVSHIAGDFTLPQDEAQPLLFIAGGVGITPFHSMISSLAGQRDIMLLYLNTSQEDVLFRDDLDAAVTHGVQTRYLQDRLDNATLKEYVPDVEKRLVYISGPDGMVRGYTHLIKSMGIDSSSIHTDRFAGY
jgi:ferredoxin-NADP reductase/Na+-transporting NADH:ubiquinone oxidoreductase subunit NqrB